MAMATLEQIISWLRNYLTISMLWRLLIVGVIIVIFVIINKVTSYSFRKILQEKIQKESIKQILKIKSYLVYLTMLLVVLGFFGVNATVLITTFGFFGIAIGFAARDVISNFLAGIILIVERNFTINDVVQFGDIVGIVREIRIRTIELETFDGNTVTIPNAKVFTSNIINMTSGSKYLQTIVWAKVAYEADIEKVKELMIESAKEVDGVKIDQKKYAPLFEIKEVDGQWGLRVEMLFYLEAHQEPWMRSKVQQKVTQKIMESDIPLHTLASRPSK